MMRVSFLFAHMELPTFNADRPVARDSSKYILTSYPLPCNARYSSAEHTVITDFR